MGRKHWEGETFHGYKERMIDSVSESYCAAKWYNATIWLGHGQTVHVTTHLALDSIRRVER